MPTKAYVIGVGMTKFLKPRGEVDYPEMGLEAATKALLDAGITYDKVQQAYVGYVYGDSICGQRALYQLGMTQIPIINVNNNCATGSTALYQARQIVEAGIVDCAMALGFEKMQPGSLASSFNDRTNPMGAFYYFPFAVSTCLPRHVVILSANPHLLHAPRCLDHVVSVMSEVKGIEPKPPFTAQIFGNAGIGYIEKYGATPEHLAKIAEKNHRHSALNPYSQFRDIYTLDQILASPKIYGPLTKLQCCPTSDGAACVVVASANFVHKHNLEAQAVEIVAQVMATDSPKMLTDDAIEWAGTDMTRKAAQEVYKKAGIGPRDVQVVELHDCFSANELITYDALGLSPPGQAHKLIDNNDVTYGGKYVVNPSGGLTSKGHPLGATGLAQCAELTWQLRGWAGDRQVANVKYALQHNIGLGGAVVITLYRKMNNKKSQPHVGYNPAIEARPISAEDVRKVAALKFLSARL
ncbi:thiolase-like protein [Jimgerdemannia flammicorona]|uniref:Thiolase-like protein n=1 Tax=Jimgerdemannia flammicorona TaxID=994334 RepID=A0A433DET5_9FUNG|nr:thiolase-like protein [Jimgerdemannia flammicorona]